MEIRRPAVFVGALGAAGIVSCALPQAARADVSWEHAITVRVSTEKKPLLRAKMYNNWSGGSHRLLLKMPISGIPDFPMAMPGSMTALQSTDSHNVPTASHALALRPDSIISAAVVTRLDEDRIVAYFSPTRQYIKEPLRPLLKRLRFNPWPKLDPKLDKEPVPSLTEEQRRRLGAEVRAVAKPALKKILRTYFRALPKTRTINGIQTHGYRLTWMMNDSPYSSESGGWGRISCEWWLGAELRGDEQLRNYRTQALTLQKEIGGMTASMWLNEFYPVLWQMMPEEVHQAAATFIPPASAARAGFGGTPVQLFMTIQPPPLQRSYSGDFHVDIVLRQRNTNPLPGSVFDAPAGYQHMPLEPELKKYDSILKGEIARGEKQADRLGFNLDVMRQTTNQLGLLPMMALTAAK